MYVWRAGVLAAVLVMAGCTQVVRATPGEIHIDTGWAGEVAPGTRHWWGWLAAREHCAEQGKLPRLADLRETVVVYRCVIADR